MLENAENVIIDKSKYNPVRLSNEDQKFIKKVIKNAWEENEQKPKVI